MTVIDELVENTQKLSSKQQIVAKYILDNWESVPFASTIEIAGKLNVSQSSVLRTIKALGFAGVPQFQKALSDYIQQRLSTIDRMGMAATNENSIESLIQSSIKQAEVNIRSSLMNLTPEAVQHSTALMESARRIYVLGMRSSASVAHFLGFNLNLLFHNVTVLANDHGLYETLHGMQDTDILIAFSFSRYTSQTVQAVNFALSNKRKIIGITDSLNSPIAGLADILLVTQVASSHITNSFVAPMALCDILLRSLVVSDSGKHLDKLRLLEDSFHQMDIFTL